ncbi:response regulator transcription factor [Ramlibacter sp. USB13]|uniref:Response regulator transcription factor n=1 Tax=Ramlibacter cellulosilyticus TaxID=2764187 RepID=A0A923MSN5_9BURK|nr:response regulator transcription factor [Ramlibacter cellulosilyticus]MBC5783097.1 response regulator transcription factor [Ramlibacter cellulosilyticus]
MHSVVIIDDHDIVRVGLEALLGRAPDLRVVASVGTLAEGVERIVRLRPDLVVSDMGLGDSAGLQTVRTLARVQAPRRLLVISMQDEMLYGEQALTLGADGYLMKDCVQENLLPAVRAVLHGNTWVSHQLTARMMNRHLRRNPAARKEAVGGAEAALSVRELQVLELLREGRTTKEIASQLHLSARTVDIHRANLKKKLGLRTGAELIAFASSRM